MKSGVFDPDIRPRARELTTPAAVIEGPLGYQFDGVTDYNPLENADGNVVFTMTGTTAAERRRAAITSISRNSGMQESRSLNQDNG